MSATLRQVSRNRVASHKSLELLPPKELERVCQGLATLDAILCEDWESRYYSFNAAWNKRAKRRMASMRNGEGDEWFLVFEPAGVFLKAFWHEYKPEDPEAIYEGLPAKLAAHLDEAAFTIEDVTFGGWFAGGAWTLRGNAKPLKEEVAMLTGDPKAYRAYAKDYFERDVPLDAIAHVLAGKKLDAKLLARVGSERTLADLKPELAEIGY